METIHITRWNDSGPRVVMVHGGVQGSTAAGERNFAAQKSLAGEGWQLIVPDRPGHGQSADPGRGDDAEADGVWVAELLGVGAHLVGHSFGGLVALAAAARRPKAVLSLVLIEPALHKLAAGNRAVRKFQLQMVSAFLFSLSAQTRCIRVMKVLGIPVADFGRDEAQLKRMGAALKRVKFPSKAIMERQLAEIKTAGVPLLIISGGWNQAFVAAGEAGADIGGGRHAISRSENHFPQWNDASFNPLLTDFWQENEAKRVPL